GSSQGAAERVTLARHATAPPTRAQCFKVIELDYLKSDRKQTIRKGTTKSQLRPCRKMNMVFQKGADFTASPVTSKWQKARHKAIQRVI
ncbi:MAG: hypothetical protein CME81_04975, partial [Halomonas sp.]|nr:hypothetical protein [Halomonas sp.]